MEFHLGCTTREGQIVQAPVLFSLDLFSSANFAKESNLIIVEV